MFVLPSVFMFMIVTVAILAITLATVIVAYSRTLTRQRQYQKENEMLKNKLHEKAGSLLEEAHRHSLQIVEDANERAQEILASTHEYVDHSNSALAGLLKVLTEKQKREIAEHAESLTEMYQNLLENLKSENINIFRNTSKDIALSTKEEFNAFTKAIEKDTILSQKELEARVEEAYRKAEQEIEEYKKTEMDTFNRRVIDAVSSAAEEILGKSLSLSDQEDIISRTLDEAHKELMKSRN